MARQTAEDVFERAIRLGRNNRYWTRLEAQAVIERLEGSGMSIAEFARQYGLQEKRLRRWRRTLPVPKAPSMREPEISLVPVRVVGTSLGSSPEQSAASQLEVVVRGGRCVRVGPGFDGEILARVVAVLEALPC